ncbi:hypothetical protein EXIGLDRAFT_603248, partial [Exidia glandulosa HHB12029]
GTGASAIYPLIGCALWPEARFVATESDTASLHWARSNIVLNNRSERIVLLEAGTGTCGILKPFHDDLHFRATFTMCNPPFYASVHEMEELAAKKAAPASTVYTGAENESVTPGGEVAFVRSMVDESAQEGMRNRCLWYTSMLGKAASVETLTAYLRSINVDNYAVYCFTHGRTRRWLLGWSWSDIRLPDVRPSLPPPPPYPPPLCTDCARTLLRKSHEKQTSHRQPPTLHQTPPPAPSSPCLPVLPLLPCKTSYPPSRTSHSNPSLSLKVRGGA